MITVSCEAGTSLYGTGERAGPLRRNGLQATGWNSDSFAYTDKTPALYQTHPWVLAVRPDGTAFGVLVETTWRSIIDLKHGITFVCDGPSPAVVIIEKDSPQEVVKALAKLTGTMPMPPLWALGYQQCRWSYEPESKVRDIAAGFRERDIPCDVIWLDIDYMDGFRCFTFDKTKFPDVKKLNSDLHAKGFKMVYMIDPGLKVDPEYFAYADAKKAGHFITDAKGNEYNGKVWPGECAFPDFTRASVRTWWASLYKDFMATGIDGVWNDMNEPAVFEVPEKTMPEDNRHDADADLGGPGPHAKYHNIYGLQMVRASREGIAAANPDKRPFVLTRASFVGGHRYAATWTGDNESDWRHLYWSIPMALNLGLSGQPFAGPDIGGFNGNATPELFARFMGIGSLLPFSRAHSVKDSKDHEPWSFGPECERSCQIALRRRYRLLPYFYTLFREAHETGLPVVRPVFFADPADPLLRGIDDAFLLGSDVLVRANTSPLGTPGPSSGHMPKGNWRAYEPVEADKELPTIHIRAGAIVPLGPVMNYIGEKPLDPLTLVINLDADGRASGTLYEDAGDGHAHASGDYIKTTYTAVRQGSTITVSISTTEGKRARAARKLEVIVLHDRGQNTATGTDGTPVTIDL
ncbi:MAG: glycoside hydrolase family 31 protein [Planctomycetota bacterium]|nr:glycoside hydrolase family 31 protein [Planctomycetota bacterium]